MTEEFLYCPDALDEIILEAKRRSGKQDALTLKLRDLGGLVRSSGDVAIEKGADLVTAEHVIEAYFPEPLKILQNLRTANS